MGDAGPLTENPPPVAFRPEMLYVIGAVIGQYNRVCGPRSHGYLAERNA